MAYSFNSIKASNSPSYEWERLRPRNIFKDKGKTHSREIYISTPESQSPRFIVKIDNIEIRRPRLGLLLLYSDEIAYKVSKFMHLDAVPKTKILHQCSIPNGKQTEKLQKYIDVMSCFKSEKYHLTFTIQPFIEGAVFASYLTINENNTNLASYQKAFLLNIVLGKFDSSPRNTILESATGKLFEIDNEYIGEKGHPNSGQLDIFSTLKQKELLPEVLDNVLNTSLNELFKIRNKYEIKEDELKQLLLNEPHVEENEYEWEDCDTCWPIILKNFIYLKMTIQSLRKQAKPIEIQTLVEGVSQFHTSDKCHLLFNAKEDGTCLHSAAAEDKEGDLLEMLIKELPGAIDEPDLGWLTPLDIAIEVKNANAAKILIANDAKVSKRNRKDLEDKQFTSVHETLGIGINSKSYAEVSKFIEEGTLTKNLPTLQEPSSFSEQKPINLKNQPVL